MKERENISYIRQGLEPSSELKRRVTERAAKLEAGRKTFGNEKTTADNRQKKKEQITMNADSTETSYVKRRFPIAVVSAAACAALVIGIAAAGLNRGKIEQLSDSASSGTTLPSAEQTEASDSSRAEEPALTEIGEPSAENAVTVTNIIGTPYTITHESRIAGIIALAERAKEYPVWTEYPIFDSNTFSAPTYRTIEYYVNGEKQTIELSEEGYPLISGLKEYLCVTVNGTRYIVDKDTPDSLYYDLRYATDKDTPMYFNNDNDMTADRVAINEAFDIIADIKTNGTTMNGAEKLVLEPGLNYSFTRNGINYSAEVYNSDDIIKIQESGWNTVKTECHDADPHVEFYQNARKWIDEINALYDSTEKQPADLGENDLSGFAESNEHEKVGSRYIRTPEVPNELSKISVYHNPEVVGFVRIPGLANAYGNDYIAYEVAQHDDNDYYLRHDSSGGLSESGSIYADCKARVTGKDRSDNITLYGNNMRKLGTMFTHLTDLNDSTGAKLNECPIIRFSTVRDNDMPEYAIIGAGCLRVTTDDCFDYWRYCDFDNDKYTFDSWITGIRNNCSKMRDIDCNADDDYLTLSTCIDAENDNEYRYVVFARKLREDETLPEGGFRVVRDRLFDTPPKEEVHLPDLRDMTEEQAAAALKEAGLNCIIEYSFSSNTEKGYVSTYYNPVSDSMLEGDLVCKGADIPVEISLGEYTGPKTQPNEDFPVMMAVFKDLRLEVPVPEGLSGSYTFSIFSGGEEAYTVTKNDMNGVNSIGFDLTEEDKMRLAVYAKNNDSNDGSYFRYATYEVDHATMTCKLIGELNTEGLLNCK